MGAWGNNNQGQLNGAGGAATAISAKGFHTLAIAPTAFPVGWGDNTFGATTAPAAANPSKAVAAGGGHSVGLLPNGALSVWGQNNLGQGSVPAGLAGVKAVEPAVRVILLC